MSATPRHFPSTCLTLLVDAQAEGRLSLDAKAEFFTRYGKPATVLVATILRSKQILSPDDVEVTAHDLVQDFFMNKIFEGNFFLNYQKTQGRLRPYLKQALRNHVTDWIRTTFRHPQEKLIEPGDALWDDIVVYEENHPEKVHRDGSEQAYDEEWTLSLVDATMTEVRVICESKGQQEHLAIFQDRHFSQTEKRPSWREIEEAYHLTRGQAETRANTVARHFRKVVRRHVLLELYIPGPTQLEIEDIKNIHGLARKFSTGNSSKKIGYEDISEYIRTQFSPEVHGLIADMNDGGKVSEKSQCALLESLNHIISNSTFYEPRRFKGVPLIQDITNLIALNPEGTTLYRLNRLLLEAVYPEEITRSYPKVTVDEEIASLLGALGS